MTLRDWVRPPRHLLLLFAAITAISAIALAWSIWQMVEQDRALGTQRAREQRAAVAGLPVNTLEQRLAAVEQMLTGIATAETGVSAAASKYLPDLAPPDLAPGLVASIDSQEFTTGDHRSVHF